LTYASDGCRYSLAGWRKARSSLGLGVGLGLGSYGCRYSLAGWRKARSSLGLGVGLGLGSYGCRYSLAGWRKARYASPYLNPNPNPADPYPNPHPNPNLRKVCCPRSIGLSTRAMGASWCASTWRSACRCAAWLGLGLVNLEKRLPVCSLVRARVS
jgi:hypothetical protein